MMFGPKKEEIEPELEPGEIENLEDDFDDTDDDFGYLEEDEDIDPYEDIDESDLVEAFD